MKEDAARRALAYLAEHHVMTLATHGPLGLWAAAVFYASDGFQLYFLSAGHTRHAQNMAASPRVAATIQEDYDDWTAIQGIQLEGTARPLAGLRQKYPAQAALIDSEIAKTGQPEAGLLYIPVLSRDTAWSVLIDAETARPVGFVPLDPY